MPEYDDNGESVPYGTFATFWNYVTNLDGDTLPTRMDRSMLTGKSGTDQKVILAALKFFDLIDGETNVIKPGLAELAKADSDSQGRALGVMVREKYADALSVSGRNGTGQQLYESLESTFGVTGDTRRKAATFFLHAAKQAGVDVSPNFPKVRASPGAGRKSNAGQTKKKKRTTTKGVTETGGDTYLLELESGGTVTVTIEADLMKLMRHPEDRTFVMALVDGLESYSDGDGDDDGDHDGDAHDVGGDE